MRLVFQEQNENKFLALTDFSCANTNVEFNKTGKYRIIWLKKDQIILTIDGVELILKANQMLFLTPHHDLVMEESSVDLVTFVFNSEFYCVRDHDNEVSCHGFLFYGSSVLPVIDLDKEEQRSFQLLQDVFIEEFNNVDSIQGEMLEMLVKRLIIKATRLAKQTLTKPNLPQGAYDLVRQFNVLVEQHFRKLHKVSDYADLLFKSPKTLSNVFSQYNDRTPLQTIQDRIIMEAKRLLLLSNKTNKEIIGYELGFDTPSHFSKSFKKSTGLSPLFFKNSTCRTKRYINM